MLVEFSSYCYGVALGVLENPRLKPSKKSSKERGNSVIVHNLALAIRGMNAEGLGLELKNSLRMLLDEVRVNYPYLRVSVVAIARGLNKTREAVHQHYDNLITGDAEVPPKLENVESPLYREALERDIWELNERGESAEKISELTGVGVHRIQRILPKEPKVLEEDRLSTKVRPLVESRLGTKRIIALVDDEPVESVVYFVRKMRRREPDYRLRRRRTGGEIREIDQTVFEYWTKFNSEVAEILRVNIFTVMNARKRIKKLRELNPCYPFG